MSFADLESGLPIANGNARRALANGSQKDPSQALASGIFQINTAVATFHRLVNSVGTAHDTPELRQKIQKTRSHIAQLVKDTSANLKQANELDHRIEVGARRKIADAKLAKDFENILRDFQKVQRLAAEKETTYSPISTQTASTLSYTTIASDGDGSSNNYLEQRCQEEAKSQKALLLDNEIAFNEAVIEERQHGILEIQQQIGEVQEIFKDLAVLVLDQGTVIDDIHSNVESSYAATSQARTHLAKASKSQKSNSSMSCLLMLIFGIVLLIVMVVLLA